MISGLLLLLGSSLAQETGLSASASLNLVRPCERDADCSLTKVIITIISIIIIILTQACVDGGCRDPCSSGSRSVCPMEGGLCKVVGHHDYHEDIFFQGGRSQTGVLVPSWNAQSQLHLHLGHLVHLRREEVRCQPDCEHLGPPGLNLDMINTLCAAVTCEVLHSPRLWGAGTRL